MDDATIRKQITRLRQKYGKIYAPLKYFRGLGTLGDVDVRDKDRALLFTNDFPRVHGRKMAFPRHNCDMETGTT